MLGLRGAIRAATSLALAAAGLCLAGPALAQQPTSSKGPGGGFGKRDAFVLSVERILGFQDQNYGDASLDSTGFHPVLWAQLGLFDVSEGGLTWGTLVGFTHVRATDGDSSFSIFTLLPRVGYAGSTTDSFGFWIRGGPGGRLIADHDAGESRYTVSLGGELYGVITPAPHVGILIGPHAEFNLFGGDSEDCPPGQDCPDPEYQSLGLTIGLMGEFW